MTRDPVILITGGLTRLDGIEYGATQTGEVERGVWANQTETVKYVLFAGREKPTPVWPGSVIAVGDALPWAQMVRAGAAVQGDDDGCQVTCADGYWACCNSGGCLCRRIGSDSSDCVAGGEGAVGCGWVPDGSGPDQPKNP